MLSGAQAATLNILPFGDSITKGVYDGDPAPAVVGGYRTYLEMLLQQKAGLAQGSGYDMVGDAPDNAYSPAYDPDHYGIPGIDANGLQTDFEANAHGGNVFNAFDVSPDVVLLHIGSNTVNGNGSSVTNATSQFDALMGSLRSSLSLFGSNVQFVLGLNMPHNAYHNWSPTDPDFPWSDAGFMRNAVANVRTYNQHIKDFVSNLLGSADSEDQAFGMRLAVADMYQIPVSSLDTQWLADLFTSGDASVLESLINTDGDEYVDWINYLDETTGTFSLTSSTIGDYANLDLLGKWLLHPEDLGYAVMANVWYNQINAVPEPGSLVLLGAGVLLVASRRRRVRVA